MNRPRLYTQEFLLSMSAEQQHAYLLRARQFIQTGNGYNCRPWLWFLLLAYFTGNTVEIEGTSTMSLYRAILSKQLTHDVCPNSNP